MERLFLPHTAEAEYCFYIETAELLTNEELLKLKLILTDGFVIDRIRSQTIFSSQDKVVEIGPRLNFMTAFSTNLLAICKNCGLGKVTRLEKFRRYLLDDQTDASKFVSLNCDRMTEITVKEELSSLSPTNQPESVQLIPLIENGPEYLLSIPGLAMDKDDCIFYYNYFKSVAKRNPTDVELKDLSNSNSEHSRHGYFKGKQVIDGIEKEKSLMELVKWPWLVNPNNSLIGFNDNSSAIMGYNCLVILPESAVMPSQYKMKKVIYHIIFTAETHNHPTGVSPLPGAETGSGGRLRDDFSTGRGGLIIAGTAGYAVANLLIPGYDLPWENSNYEYPKDKAEAIQILLKGSDGVSDYGNKFGEPLIVGFTRSMEFGFNKERWGFVKPILFTGGLGAIRDEHLKKDEPEPEMLIVQIGGPAYPIGIGGGAASSLMQGSNSAELDFASVQRGDAEMENKANRVVAACVAMGKDNPIRSIHDQGAGGPANVLKEIVGQAGGRIEIRNINLGDKTMSVVAIYIAEYQERFAILIWPKDLSLVQEIAKRERVPLEVLGKITGDGRFVVHDKLDNSTPVDINLADLLDQLPQKTFADTSIFYEAEPLQIPEDLIFTEALELVLKHLDVGSKRFLTNKVDRSVKGLVVQQQCCGPMQLPVADCGIVALSHSNKVGAVSSIGEQAPIMILNPAAGARLAVAEALLNMSGAVITKLQDIKFSGNWMWAPKLPGEGAALYQAAEAVSKMLVDIGSAIDGGKDSLSMATKVGEKYVKSRELVMSGYCSMSDTSIYVTPDIKKPGKSSLVYIPVNKGIYRLGGSVFARVLKQTGETPDVDNVGSLVSVFKVIQDIVEKKLVLSLHDVSDGGLIVSALEMVFAGNCGFDLEVDIKINPFNYWFAQEPGVMVEVDIDKFDDLQLFLIKNQINYQVLGCTTNHSGIKIVHNKEIILQDDMRDLRNTWEETSYQLELIQNSVMAWEESVGIYDRPGPQYKHNFNYRLPVKKYSYLPKPEIAIFREEGSNGDVEMAAFFQKAGFKTWDV
ncbi:MAG: phosphoribosylformylglycinamidine synthase, partial [Patescibacteria group bacterium]